MSTPSRVEAELSTPDFLALAQPGVQRLSPYVPSKPAGELTHELGTDLAAIVKPASNGNPLGVGPKMLEAIRAELAELAHYLDDNGFELKHKLTEHCAVNAAQVTLGNGSGGIPDLVTRAYLVPGLSAVLSECALVVYSIATQAAGAKGRTAKARAWGHDLKAMLAAIGGQTRTVLVANPDNPTGTRPGADALERFFVQVPAEALVVLDEAYIEYTEGNELPDGLDCSVRRPNLLVSRVFSKAYGLASLRVGYALSSRAVTDVLSRMRQPFNVNSLVLAVACAVLDGHDYLAQSRHLNDSGMAQLEDGFHALSLPWIPSKDNFIAADLTRDVGSIYRILLREGVIVRPVAGYGIPAFLRAFIGLPEEDDRFLQVLGKVLTHD